MNRSEKIRMLARILNAEKAHIQLNVALTHSSYYLKENTEKSNSRYVFTGMFAFKGEVASYLSLYVPGTGMQLQQALGNFFRNENLIKLFDRFGLEELIRCGSDFDAEKHRHIFAFGLLGFVYRHSSKEDLHQFISRYIIIPNHKYIDFSFVSKDMEGQCNVLSKLLYGSTVQVETMQTGEKKFTSIVRVNGHVLSDETTGAYRYSRQKALKKALKALADDLYFIESQKPEFIARINKIEELQAEKARLQKEEKLKLQAEKEERKRIENALKKSKRAEEKRERDLARKKAKAEAKKKKESQKGKNTIYRSYTAEEIAAMNPGKRRRLEDLGILPKLK